MDHRSRQRDLANKGRRRRYASLSAEEKEMLSQSRCAAYARRVASRVAMPSSAAGQTAQHQANLESLNSISIAPGDGLPYQFGSVVGSVLPSPVPRDSVGPSFNLITESSTIGGSVPVIGVESEVGESRDEQYRQSCTSQPIDSSSLCFEFEVGQTSAGSVGVNDGLHGTCSVSSRGAFEIGQSSSAAVDIQDDSSVPIMPPRHPGPRRRLVDRFGRIRDVPTVPWTLPGAASCLHCGAKRFFREGAAFCCSNGQICLPKPAVLKLLLIDLIFLASNCFLERICDAITENSPKNLKDVKVELGVEYDKDVDVGVTCKHAVLWRTNSE